MAEGESVAEAMVVAAVRGWVGWNWQVVVISQWVLGMEAGVAGGCRHQVDSLNGDVPTCIKVWQCVPRKEHSQA